MNQERVELIDEKTVTVGREPAEESTSTVVIGSIFAGKYEILDLLGKGGMSAVYRARHIGMNKIVAVKVLHMHLANDDLSIRRFQQEAQAASQLTHPGIVGVYDYGESNNGMPYLVMEYVEGQSLSESIRENGPISEERFLSLFSQVTSALAHAHERGIVHRDLKPSNIMLAQVDGKENARIVDFGIAKLVSGSSEEKQQLTQTGEVFGSPLYMSPEQCSGAAVDGRADIYSLGCVMYESLTGKVPFRGSSVVETIHKHLNDPPPKLVAPLLSDTSKQSLELIVLRCLAKLPDERFQKMTEIESNLRRLNLKSKSGILGALGGAWDLASAKRRAAKASKLPLLIFALALSLSSVVLLGIGLAQNNEDIARLRHSRNVITELAVVQSNFLMLAEYTRRYMASAMLHPQTLKREKKNYERAAFRLSQSLKHLDRLVASTQGSIYNITRSKAYQERLMQAPDEAKVGVDQIETSRSYGVLQISAKQIAVAAHLADVCQEGSDVLDDLAKEAIKQERKQMKQFEQTMRRITVLGVICVLINGSVIISLIAYFARGTQERLRKLAENASRLSRKRAASGAAERDEVADLDNVLQELATALTDAEEREKVLLEKLRIQEQAEK